MSLRDFRIIEAVGKGSFASVFKVMRKSDSKIYALKRVKINKMSKKEISDALNEIRFLASIRQKNIVGFLEAFLENNETELCIVMEYCGCGDLAQKIERYKRRRQYIDEDVIWRYLIQGLKALQHLHEKNILHRDIKAANTFISEDGSIKIGDMNVSKRLNKGHLQTQIGTPYYMSPEIWQNRPYDASSDIWSLGCMIYELATLRPPFVGDSFPSLKRAVTQGRYSPIPSKYSDSLSRVIGQMLKLSPRHRPSATALLRCPEIIAKLHLDERNSVPAAPAENLPTLMDTIKVPHNLRKLNNVLPRACYPDVRPNSPAVWTVAEQRQSKRDLMIADLMNKKPVNVQEVIKENESVADVPAAAIETSCKDNHHAKKAALQQANINSNPPSVPPSKPRVTNNKHLYQHPCPPPPPAALVHDGGVGPLPHRPRPVVNARPQGIAHPGRHHRIW